MKLIDKILGKYTPQHKIGFINLQAYQASGNEKFLKDAELAFEQVLPKHSVYYASQFRLAICKVALKKFTEADTIISGFETKEGKKQISNGKRQIPETMMDELKHWLEKERKK